MTAVTGQELDTIMAGAVNLFVQDNMGREPSLVPQANIQATPAVTQPNAEATVNTPKPTDYTPH